MVEEVYTDNVDLFRKQAEFDRRENGLLSNVSKLRAQVKSPDQIQREDVALSRLTKGLCA